jgi:hypothetical protein
MGMRCTSWVAIQIKTILASNDGRAVKLALKEQYHQNLVLDKHMSIV